MHTYTYTAIENVSYMSVTEFFYHMWLHACSLEVQVVHGSVPYSVAARSKCIGLHVRIRACEWSGSEC